MKLFNNEFHLSDFRELELLQLVKGLADEGKNLRCHWKPVAFASVLDKRNQVGNKNSVKEATSDAVENFLQQLPWDRRVGFHHPIFEGSNVGCDKHSHKLLFRNHPR